MKTFEVIELLGKDLTKVKILVDSCFSLGETGRASIREKLLAVDEEIFKFCRDANEADAAKEKDGMDENGFPLRITTPDSVVAEQSEKLFGFLSDSFLISDPIFNIPSIPNQSRLTSAIGDYITRNSNIYKWRTDLQKVIQDIVWYNRGVLECYVENGDIKFKSIRPDKVILDESVQENKIVTEASYYGYEEEVSLTRAATMLKAKGTKLTSLGEKLDKNLFKLFTADYVLEGVVNQTESSKYDTYCTTRSSLIDNEELDFTQFMTEKEQEDYQPVSKINVKVLYKRLDPAWLDIESFNIGVKDGYTLPLYRVVSFNGIPVIIEDVSDGSSDLIFGTTYLDTEKELALSHAERLIPVQVYSAKLQTSRIAAIREILRDSYIYNEQYIEIDGPIKRIKANALVDTNPGIDQIYRQDRKDYNELQTLLGSLGEVQDLADKISGNNPAVSGQHVVGNRTAVEGRKLVMSAESRFNLRKLMIQQTLFEPIQRLLIKMCIINRTNIRYFDAAQEKLVPPTEEELTLVSYYLDIGDGGLPSSDEVAPEAIEALMVMATQNQQITETYDAGDLFKQFALSLGFKRIHDVRRPHDPMQELGVSQQGDALPTNQQGALDENGQAVDANGQPVDANGQPIQGQALDANGQPIQGQPAQAPQAQAPTL